MGKALKIASRTKDESLEKISMENEGLKRGNKQMMNDTHRLREELKNANQRIVSYSKAVNMLKDNNSKLAQQVDDLNANQIQKQQQMQVNQQYMQMHNQSQTMNGNNGNNDQSELSNQFQSLLSMQKQSSLGTVNSNVSDNGSAMGGSVMKGVNNNDDKQANSTDVVCAFLKDHPEIVGKLKNSNQIMYANIITDDKYASQFLKKCCNLGMKNIRMR